MASPRVVGMRMRSGATATGYEGERPCGQRLREHALPVARRRRGRAAVAEAADVAAAQGPLRILQSFEKLPRLDVRRGGHLPDVLIQHVLQPAEVALEL